LTNLARRDWLPEIVQTRVSAIAARTAGLTLEQIASEIDSLVLANRRIHDSECVNLNPATNVMNPRAEAMLAAGLGTRPSLGYPGDKYEMGLEAIEAIEVIAADLAAEIFAARFVEIRVASGAAANLYAFMATCEPGDAIIVPPDSIGGHVTHHRPGAAGLYRLTIEPAAVDASGYTLDLDALRTQARRLRPKLISIGGSLNLFAHPVGEIRRIADEVGAYVLFDAAHLSGLIAGKAWPNPLAEGAHVMTMSTYKSLGGPPAGLIATNSSDLAKRIEAIAFPGLTANFDVAKSAALAVTLLDWKACGADYARTMAACARRLAAALDELGLPVFLAESGATTSHQFALAASRWGGGQKAAKALRAANLLASGIGLPLAEIDGDLNGLRFGTPEIVRWGMSEPDMPELAQLIARALIGNEEKAVVGKAVQAFRQRFQRLHFIRAIE
jgi:glycine hydroxymethyltransferase